MKGKLMLTAFALLWSTAYYAAKENLFEGIKGSGINNSAEIEIADSWEGSYMTGTAANHFQLESSVAKVKLWFDDALKAHYASNWELKLSYQIELTGITGVIDVYNHILSINYDPSIPYKDIAFRKYDQQNYRRAKVTQIQIISNTLPQGIIPDDIHLDVELDVIRYYRLEPTEQSIPSHNTNYLSTTNELEVHWPYVEGAESYDLEWSFVDVPYPNPIDNTYPGNYDFSTATRVNVLDNRYRISLAYPRGIFVFRIRPVGKKLDDNGKVKRVEGTWSIPFTNAPVSSVPQGQKYEHPGLEEELNWLYQANFAEEGKRAESLQVFDGSLKPRQTVAINNSDNTAVISQPIYDYLGRPSLSLLPVPQQNQGLGFYPNRSEFPQTPNSYYDYTHFDKDDPTSNPTDPNNPIDPITPLPMSNANGSLEMSKYFNDDGSAIGVHANYVPDVEDYPFSRTVFKNDGSNRPKVQTMLGQTQIGAGRLNQPNAQMTHYYYATPTQEELYKLFGNEVGNAAHYQKNMTIDPNGQAHLQYIDMHGRIIATGLAGDSPDNLLDIDTPLTFDQIIADLTVNNYIDDNNQLLISKNIAVSSPIEYTFSYSLDQLDFDFPCLNNNGYNLYAYDLLIYVENENHQRVPMDYNGDGNTNNNEIEYLIEDIHSQGQISWSKVLEIGTYTVVKILKLNEDHIETLREQLNVTGYCLTPPGAVSGTPCNDLPIDCFEQYASVDASGNITYKNEEGLNVATVSSSNTLIAYHNGYDAIDLQNVLMAIQTCESGIQIPYEDACAQKLEQMKADLSPGGQYFDNRPFNSFQAPNNTWLSDINNVTIPNFYTNLLNGATGWDYIRDNWDPSFADDLVQFHPEYCVHRYNCGEISGGFERPQPLFNQNITIPDCAGFNGLSTAQYNAIFNGINSDIDPTDFNGYWFNPLNLTQSTLTSPAALKETYQPALDNLNDNQIDPFVACRNQLFDVIAQRLTQYLDVFGNGTEYHSIWYLLDDPDNIHLGGSGYPSAIEDIYQQLHGNNTPSNVGILGTGPGQVTKFQFFRSTYLFIREQVNYNEILNFYPAPGSGCSYPITRLTSGTANNSLTNEGFRILYPVNPVFDNYDPSSTTSIDNYINSSVANHCQSVCESYAQDWLATLGTCASDNDKEIMKNYFIDICAGSCDVDHLFGGDDLGSGSVAADHGWGSNTFSSFQQVVNHYNTVINTSGNCTAPVHDPAPPSNALEQQHCICTNVTAFVESFFQSEGIPINSNPISLSGLSGDQEDELLERLEEVAQDGTTYTIAQIQIWIDNCANGVAFSNVPDEFLCSDFPTTSAQDLEDDCGQALDDLTNYNNNLLHLTQVKALIDEFINAYRNGAWNNIYNREVFTMSYTPREYHYTLFYYDQAGNLIKTVPPEGIYVQPSDAEGLSASQIQDCFLHLDDPDVNPYVHPDHEQVTNYRYNSLQQLVEQHTPDGGKTIFFYDQLGRLLVSQNDRQAAAATYSYSLYDELGRVVEAGEVSGTAAMNEGIAQDASQYYNWLNASGPNIERKEVMQSTYGAYANTAAETEMGDITPLSLRNRIASTAYYSDLSNTSYDNAQHYSYDYQGNVKSLIQENTLMASVSGLSDQTYKRIDYEYDLISGNVNQMSYQDGEVDAFYHAYEYDANNRLTNAYSSTNGEIWEKECKSFYYAHGPLARKEIGDQLVQAQDYLYTANGWTKGMNASVPTEERDMGRDGKSGHQHEYVGRDVMGFSLHYYDGDYNPVDAASSSVISSISNTSYQQQSPDLYNGNISKMLTSISDLNQGSLPVFAAGYQYDQLQRIRTSNIYKSATGAIRTNNTVSDVTASNNNDYATSYSFDGNGNLKSLNRRADGGVMDDFTYIYDANKINQLDHVTDAIPAASFTVDVDAQGSGNYFYDPIGQLAKDASEDIGLIQWTATGKVKRINYDDILNPAKNTPIQYISFDYDAAGMRVGKRVQYHTGAFTHTFYTHDASGNVVAIYTHNNDMEGTVPTPQFKLEEHLIYGSKRLGSMHRNLNLPHTPEQEGKRELGHKQYELSEHRGNVMQVISDRKLSIDDNANDQSDYYTADVTSFSDYYPYGMQMPKRNGNTGAHRYGFQSQEMDDEIKGNGNSVNYKYRMHDPRIARFFAEDPLTAKYPELTPYQFSSNSPVYMIELEGLEGVKYYTPEGMWTGYYSYPEYHGGWSNPFGNAGTWIHRRLIDCYNGSSYVCNMPKRLYDSPTLSAGITDEVNAIDKGVQESVEDVIENGPNAENMSDVLTTIVFKKVPLKIPDANLSKNKLDIEISAKQNDANVKPGDQANNSAEPLGGAYSKLKNDVGADSKNTTERHHMPANSTNSTSTGKGGSIKMSKAHHQKTASWGNSKAAQQFRARQAYWQSTGNFQKAFDMDVRDIRSKFGNIYDNHINQLIDYYKKEGKLDSDYTFN